MSQIRILGDDVINRIAAGEVIQRPASVVKELVENAIDAGATKIDITIKGGGKRSIRVDDNGWGMDEEDLLLSIERHATSKVNEDDDIFGAHSLGFRGEALPSIAAVSSLTIESCSTPDEGGNILHCLGGVIKDVTPCARARGTSVEIKRLFYNTPARRKFLKSDNVEAVHIRDVVTAVILTHPEIAISYRSDGRQLLKSSGDGQVLNAIVRIYGATDGAQMVEVAKQKHPTLPFSIWGAVSTGLASRSSSGCIVLSVNGRTFKSYPINRTIQQTYSPYIAPKRWPIALLFIEADPRIVDVNVHPSKMEVRFTFFDKLGRFITTCVQDAVRKTIPEVSVRDITGERAVSGERTSAPEEETFEQRPLFKAKAYVPPPREPALVREHQVLRDYAKQGPLLDREYDVPTVATEVPEELQFTIMGQVFETYIIALTSEKLLLCDQHAAHERILYERVLAGARQSGDTIQRLLVPQRIPMARDQLALLKENKEDLLSSGLVIEWADDAIIVRGVPSLFEGQDLRTIVLDLLDGLSHVFGEHVKDDRQETVAATVACKAAIKANHPLTTREMRTLLLDLFKCDHPMRCPHGRPTLIEVTESQLEKSFLRRQ